VLPPIQHSDANNKPLAFNSSILFIHVKISIGLVYNCFGNSAILFIHVNFSSTTIVLTSACPAMFDWQAELAVPVPVPKLTQTTLPSQLGSVSVPSPPLPVVSAPLKSFTAALGGNNSPTDDVPLPVPCINGDSLSIRIGQEEYVKGLAECQNALRGRLTLVKGDKPYTTRDLVTKIAKLWKTACKWKMVPLGRGCYDFHFDSPNDLRNIWSAGTVNLKPGLLRLCKWTKDFNHYSQRQTHVSIWIRLIELLQEYWRERTLKEIASAIGTPIDLDGPTRSRAFGHYARILVDIDLSKRAFDEILVEREGYAFKVEVQYERRPLFCHHCYVIGHNVTTCKWLHPEATKALDRGKKAMVEGLTLKGARQLACLAPLQDINITLPPLFRLPFLALRHGQCPSLSFSLTPSEFFCSFIYRGQYSPP